MKDMIACKTSSCQRRFPCGVTSGHGCVCTGIGCGTDRRRSRPQSVRDSIQTLTGFIYGGDTDTWSKQTMEVIMRRYVAGATHVIVVDIHTGLGPFANAEVITNEPKKSSGYRRAVKLWGDLVRTTHVEESYSVHISGAMKLAIPRLLPGAEVTAVSLEFGTYHGADVFWALREENWLQHHGGEAHSDQRRIKTALRRMFYPSDDEWKRRVWYQGREVINQALAGIR